MGTGLIRILTLSIVLAIVFTWFALSNSQVVTVSLMLWSKQISLSLVILISILIGIIFTAVIAAWEQTRILAQFREVEKKLKHDEDLLHGAPSK